MANFDMTQAKVAVDLSNPDFVRFATFVSGTANFWDWTSTSGHLLDVIGSGLTYVTGHATAGTVSAIGIDLGGNNFGLPELAITGLNVSASTLDNSPNAFWRILAGDDTFSGPLATNVAAGTTSLIFGDGLVAQSGVANGGIDQFDAGDTAITVIGDVVNVGSQSLRAADVDYRGGNDLIVGRATAERQAFYGDASNVNASGRLTGGSDSIIFKSSAILPTAAGDALSVEGIEGRTAVVIGGKDLLDARDVLAGADPFGVLMVGDVVQQGSFSRISGGNDFLLGSIDIDHLIGDVGASGSSPLRGGDDTILGNGGDDNIVGEVFNAGSGLITGGNDVLYGGDGKDRIFGEFANGTPVLSGGNDQLFGEAGDDFLRGQSGNDVLNGGAGADDMDGGTGRDTASYMASLAAVAVSLSGSFASQGDAIGDILLSIESLIGTSFVDLLAGDGNANRLTGGLGGDVLVGTLGKDVFDYNNVNESRAGSVDMIASFEEGGNGTFVHRIDLSSIDAIYDGADDDFTFIGNAAFSALGQVRVVQVNGDTIVLANSQDNLSADLRIKLSGLHTLGVEDFIL